MEISAAPLQIVAISAAVLWPLALGATFVLWTKARAADRRRKLAAIEHGLQGMFRSVETQPAPGRLEMVVDALDEQVASTVAAAAPLGRKAEPAS